MILPGILEQKSVPVSYLYAGLFSTDTVKKYDIGTQTLKWAVSNHSNPITSLALSSNHIFSGDRGGTWIKNDLQGTEIYRKSGYNRVLAIQLDEPNGYIYTLNNDNTLRKFEDNGNDATELWSVTFSDVSLLSLIGNNLFVSLDNGDIKKIDTSGNVIWTFSGFGNKTYEIVGDSTFIYSGSADNTLRKIEDLGSSPSEVWSTSFTDIPFSLTLNGDKTTIYAGTFDNRVHKIDSSGNQLTSGNFPVRPGVNDSDNLVVRWFDNNLYVGTNERFVSPGGKIIELNTNGTENWRISEGAAVTELVIG